MRVKESFERKYRMLLGDEYELFLESLFKPLRDAIRVNTLKVTNVDALLRRLEAKGWRLEQVPWYPHGFWVSETGGRIGATVEHCLGYYYVQDAASMIPPVVLDPKPGEVILDMCAAPGSKTTQMAQMMENKGVIIANDPKTKRIAALGSNIQRCGVMNCVITQMDGRAFGKLGPVFDKVLVDAPCTCTGTIMRSPEILATWGPYTARSLSRLQKQLLRAASRCVKKEGIIVYSVCSLEPEEGEFVVDYAVRKLGLEVEEVNVEGLKARHGLSEWMGRRFASGVENSLRVYPHDNWTEGFFVAKLVKA